MTITRDVVLIFINRIKIWHPIRRGPIILVLSFLMAFLYMLKS